MSTIVSKNVQIGADGTASNNFTAYQPATPDGTLRIGNGNSGSVTDRITLTSAGNVGIGTSSPNGDLHIVSSGTETAGDINSNANELVLDNSAGNVGITFKSPNTSNARINFGDPEDNNVGAILYDHSSNFLNFYVNASERARIDSSGNVGIGTSSPVVNLHVKTSGSTYIRAERESAGYIQLGATLSENQIYSRDSSDGNRPLVFTIGASERARIDSSGNVGIGTSSPTQKLTIEGAMNLRNGSRAGAFEIDSSGNLWMGTATTAGNIIFESGHSTTGLPSTGGERARIDSSGNFTIGAQTATRLEVNLTENDKVELNAVDGTNTARNLVFSTGDTERVRIDSAGNVGIGTTVPNFKTHISTGSTASITQPTAGSYGLYVQQNTSGSTGGIYIQDGASNSGNSLFIGDNNGAARLVVNGDGNVGIGTSSPAEKLEVAGGIRLSSYLHVSSGSTGKYFGLGSSITGAYAATDLAIWNVSAGNTIFYQNGGERARITSSGDLLVGTTTSEGRITIRGDSCGGYIGSITNENASNCNPAHGLIFKAGYSGSASGSNFFSFRRPDNTVLGSISQSGASTVSYNTSSDYRLKEDITPMVSALEKVAALKPVTYKWKEFGDAGQGFIAHELAEVVPEAVTGTKDAVDAEGNPEYQGIDTSFLVATLTAAIQEQQAIITQQAAAIESLTARVSALEGN